MKSAKKLNNLDSDHGFTLSEVVVVLFITGIVMSAIATLSLWGAQEFRRLQEELTAQRDVLRLETTLRNYLPLAINVVATDIAPGDQTLADRRGRFLGPADGTALVCDELGDGGGCVGSDDIITIAAFYREWGFSNDLQAAATVVSEPRPTGLFFLKPSARTGGGITQNSRAGVMFLDTGANVTPGVTVDPVVEPGFNDVWFAGITEISVQKKIASRAHEEGDVRLMGYTLRFNMRFHLRDGLDLTFCPTADIGTVAGCDDSGGPYFDIQREVRITLANNDLYYPVSGRVPLPPGATAPADDWVFERPLGFLHFFRPIFPDVFAN